MANTKQVLNKAFKKRKDELRGSLRPKCEEDLSTNPLYRSKREESFKEKQRRKERKHKNKIY
tara:strand:+ start:117 stop:302 length:186 start_codon:yes stop_codon:yes gene_type:complete